MFDIWPVVEELAATAYEHGTNRVSMSQIAKELRGAQLYSAHNVEEVRKALNQLDYRVEGRRSIPRNQPSITPVDL